MFFSAPTASPDNVSASKISTFSITVQWERVNCIERNGNITGYIVQYGAKETEITKSVNISGIDNAEVTLTGLTSATKYSIKVAAVNNAGTGVYSEIDVITKGIVLHNLFILLKL